MRGTTRKVAVAAVSAVALLAAGCGGGDGDSSDSAAAGAEGGEITIRGCNPENTLVAGNTAETCGGDVLNVLISTLVHYDPESAEPSNDIAESIETDDNQNFTVKIKQGYMFHDGTEVKAKNFVDAWNYTAFGPNGQEGSYFMSVIEGAEEVGAEDSTTEEMSGLAVVDDYTFTIKTTEKVSNLPIRLGYTAFAPQPDSFFEDPEAFGKNPVGAGPYKFDSWTENQAIVVSKFADYAGEFGGNVDQITFRIFQDSGAAYSEVVAGNLDLTDDIPTSALIDNIYQSDLPDRNAAKATSYYGYIGINPEVDKDLSNPDVRRAISMAIDRQQIVDTVYNGTYTPATGWVSPVVDGYQADVCGESCVFDPEAAKAMLEEAGGFPGDKLTLSYNADSDHKAWTEATCNSIKNTLEIDCVATPLVDFSTFLTKLSDREMKGLFRSAWVMDYPSIENYLGPIYGKGAGSNYFDYDSDEFNSLLSQAAGAEDLEEANSLYQQAEQVLAQDFPTIPLWYGESKAGWSERVDNVVITPFGRPDLRVLTVSE
ncbi:ABC transporter substrate-binding protein [Phycicoccus sp. CSK15P-2]|uniref:peptide ABC transporter substrate-binding protein n=1 Tax=Phycicoccus sp. CSK15P-2 TaxID=2807627 RepID=UPI00194FCCAC|nr:ABC transporter substrate-binding protein [Phycicoccus sp. CSK15P-2]MBM6405230.1 ABC transporter substrate-binding protein [Phycicoccus sp. CSK15P-2]